MTLAQFQQLETELNACVFERATEIRGLLAATIAGRNVYMLGVPGVAKSQLVVELTRRIHGATIFQKLMARTTTPDEIFGPLNVQEFLAGRRRLVTQGMLPCANFAFLDEINCAA